MRRLAFDGQQSEQTSHHVVGNGQEGTSPSEIGWAEEMDPQDNTGLVTMLLTRLTTTHSSMLARALPCRWFRLFR
jgi:hypothetical protein